MIRRSILFSIVSAVLAATATQAADPPSTTITVQGMHCVMCAAKVSEKLKAVPGVQAAEVDPVKATAVVATKTNAMPSPRAMWEAVEKAGYTPTKLVSPVGTFTSKPKS